MDFLTLKQAAARLVVHKNTLIEWERNGRVPPARRFRRTPEGVFIETTSDPQELDWRGYTEDDITGIHELLLSGVRNPNANPRPSTIGGGYMSARQIHAVHGVHWASIARYARQGRMPPSKPVGTGRVWKTEDVQMWLHWTNHELYAKNKAAKWETAYQLMQKSDNPYVPDQQAA